jgi:hypothetical protein
MTPDKDILGKWNYGTAPRFPYGEETSYQKAMDFLDGPYVIEDRGCGTTWARNFVKRGRYVGVDGSWSLHCDTVADLRKYRSSADAILLRHVLDHNWDWKKILENALASFQKKLCLVIFTPFGQETRTIATTWETIPDISFKKSDLTELLKSFPYTEETIKSATQYGTETLFYVTK